MAKDVIIALDFHTREETIAFLDRFPDGKKPFIKIGMELFYSEGPQIVRELKARGHKIFLDLKLHDIPNTVKRTMSVLSQLDVDMLNLHAAGTSDMMKAALEGLARPDETCEPGSGRPLLIAVTQLTSTAPEALKDELLIDTPMEETVLAYAKNAADSGLDGVVCSPLEAALVKERCGEAFCTVTPGVRFADGDADDQKRIMTPEKARQSGCDYIVMGRPITQAEDPYVAYEKARSAFLYGGDTSAWLDAVLPKIGEYIGEHSYEVPKWIDYIEFKLECLDAELSDEEDFDPNNKFLGKVYYGKCGWLLYMQVDVDLVHWDSEPLYINHPFTDYSEVDWVARRDSGYALESSVPLYEIASDIEAYAREGGKRNVLRKFGHPLLNAICNEEFLGYEYVDDNPDYAHYEHISSVVLKLEEMSDLENDSPIDRGSVETNPNESFDETLIDIPSAPGGTFDQSGLDYDMDDGEMPF